MSESQKRASAVISFAALLAAVIVAAWLAHLAMNSTFTNDPDDAEQKKLLMSWASVVWFIKSATLVKVIYGGLLTIIGVGTGILGELYKKTSAIIALAVLCLLGIAACTVIMIELADPENLKILRYYSDYEELAELRSGVDTLFGSAIGWFTSCLGTQLGISLAARGGVAKRLFSRAKAAGGD